MPERNLDVVIAGGGPAGLSAALMLGRAGRSVLVVDQQQPRNRFASHMHGVLGHDGKSPVELASIGRAEVQGYGVEIVDDEITQVLEADTALSITLASGEQYSARILILATGMTDELPDIPGLAEHWGTRVLHCPYCHGYEVIGQRLGVLATTPHSVHQASMVRQWSEHETFFTAAINLDHAIVQRLQSRGVEIEPTAVTRVSSSDAGLTVELDNGEQRALDALFVAGNPVPHEALVSAFNLEREENRFGSFIKVDMGGATSHPRIFAAGNVVQPGATVVVSMAAGSMAGGMANAKLVEWDFDDAERTAILHDPRAFWEQKYGASDRVWSGAVNPTVAEVAGSLPPGRALDLGCGEGADVLWLAERGWRSIGIDLSLTAVERARAVAELSGSTATFVHGDLAKLPLTDEFELVTASFLQSPVALPRIDILRTAAARVAIGGHLLITSHAQSEGHDTSAHQGGTPMPAGPEEELAELALPSDAWQAVKQELRPRTVTTPDGRSMKIADSVLVLQRLA